LDSRTREIGKKKDFTLQSREQERKDKQDQLFEEKYEELKSRYDEDKVLLGNQLGIKSFHLSSVQSFETEKQLLQKASKNQLIYDQK